ncbi:hypothetical protein D3C81_1216940 [compost metagenome]
MFKGLFLVEHGRKAHIAAFEQRRPLRTGPRLELRSKQAASGRPVGAVCLLTQRGRVQLQSFEELLVELGLDRADRYVLAIGAFVDIVEWRPRIQQVGASLRSGQAGRAQPGMYRQQRRHAIDNCRVDDLPLAGGTRLQDGAHDAKCGIDRAAGIVADDIERYGRRLALTPDRIEQSGDRDVVDIVPGRLGQRAILAPAGQPAVHQSRIAREACIRPQSEPLGDTGAESLDQCVRLVDQRANQFQLGRILQIDLDRLSVAQHQIKLQRP